MRRRGKEEAPASSRNNAIEKLMKILTRTNTNWSIQDSAHESDMAPNSPSYQPGSGKAAGEIISSNAEMFVSRKEVFSMV